MSQDHDRPDPDDLFAHTRMSLGDHIEELRVCLVRAGKGFLIALVIGFFVAHHVLAFIRYPIEKQLTEFDEIAYREQLAKYEEERKKDPQSQGEAQDIPVEVDTHELADAFGLPRPTDRWITLSL